MFDDVGDLDLLDFDDTEYDIRSPAEWIALVPKLPPKIAEDKKSGLKARGLRIFDDGGGGEPSGVFQEVVVCEWDPVTNYFSGLWYEDETEAELSRLDLFFDGEDPVTHADRIANAFYVRSRVYQHIKFLFFVDNMPSEGISTLDSDQIERVKKKARNIALLQSSSLDYITNNMIKEICLDYARVLNRLTLIASGHGTISDVAQEEDNERANAIVPK